MSENDFDFERFKAEAIKGMYAGKPLSGEKGIFAPLLKHFLEAALEGEPDAHLQEEKATGTSDRRNGKIAKRVKSISGEFDLETSCDRASSFDPVVLPKRQVIITEELEDKVIGLHSLGLSTRDITKYMKEMYQMDVSAATLSSIIDKVIPAMNEWRQRPVDSVYAFIYLNCMYSRFRIYPNLFKNSSFKLLAGNFQHTFRLFSPMKTSEGLI